VKYIDNDYHYHHMTKYIYTFFIAQWRI